MADAIIYSSMDAAGPGLPTAGSHVERMYNVLVPCLVTGYGAGAEAKPGQGWSLVHAELPNGFTLQAPDGVYYIFYKGSGTRYREYYCQVYMAEALSLFEYPPTGTNVRSGDYSPDYSAGIAERLWSTALSAARSTTSWWLIARGSQVIFSAVAIDVDSTSGSSASSGSDFGDLSFLGNLVLKAPGAPSAGVQNAFFLGGFKWPESLDALANVYRRGGNMFGDNTRLRDPLTGIIEQGDLGAIEGNPAKHNGQAYAHFQADPLGTDLALQRVDAFMPGQGSIGYIPGMFYGGRAAHYRISDLLSLLGLGSTYSATLTPAEIDGELFYVVPTYWGSLLVCLAEKYWT